MKKHLLIKYLLISFAILSVASSLSAANQSPSKLTLKDGSRIVIFGNGLASRMIHFGHFETELYLRNANKNLVIRNIADEGNTPSFRPHSGRKDQLGFPGADKFYGVYAHNNTSNGVGHFETEEIWLSKLAPDQILITFGFTESFLTVPPDSILK